METLDFVALRTAMVDGQIAGRGVRSPNVLDAMRSVPREAYLPERLREFAYEDTPIEVVEGHTVPQPSVVAMMADALALTGHENVLQIGSGCGYSTAILARLAKSVFTVEPVEQLAARMATAASSPGLRHVHVRHGAPEEGWTEHAPFDAIVVHPGGRQVPESLRQQLAVGGRLVMPVGADAGVMELVRVTRISETDYRTEDIADVRFAALRDGPGVAAGRSGPMARGAGLAGPRPDAALVKSIATTCEKFATPASANLDALLYRIGSARIVLLGEATHGTSEFYRMRERISRDLIQRKGFSFVAIEGDWPDAARIDQYVRGAGVPASEWTAFARFPVWMWRNREVRSFVDWLHAHNAKAERKVAFHGLDLYSLYNSIRSVLAYLDDVDPATAKIARHRYACLTPWQSDPAAYGRAALSSGYQLCEREVVAMLTDLLRKGPQYGAQAAGLDGERLLDAVQNARLIANAERYYRTMYYGSRASWNLRDGHMFETLKHLLAFHGPDSKAIVWAHNSHVGDSAATDMALRGEFNIGHLCRKAFGRSACLIGFGTNSGTVAAASDWDAPMEVKTVRPALAGSHERLCHEAGVARFVLPLRGDRSGAVVNGLASPRLERAIGVIYRPQTELQSHYFQAVLPQQFDEYIWFDETQAVTPLKTEEIEGLPETYPFGL